MVLDGGRCQVGIESTVLSLANGEPVLLRPGMVTLSEIERRIGFVSYDTAAPQSGGHAAPGQHAKHYSPATRVILTREIPPDNAAYLWWSRERPTAISVRMPSEPAEYARELYAALHRLDGMGLDVIAIEPPPEEEQWAAIRDRLKRAAYSE